MLLAHLVAVIAFAFTVVMRTPQIPTTLASILSWRQLSPPSYIYSGLQYALPWNRPYLDQPPIPSPHPRTPQPICPNLLNVTLGSSLYKNWCSAYEEPGSDMPQLHELLHVLVPSSGCSVDRFPKLCRQAIGMCPRFLRIKDGQSLSAAICCICLLLIVFVDFYQCSITDNEKIKLGHEETRSREVILFQSLDEINSTALFDILFGNLRSDTRLNIEAAAQFVFKDDLEESEHLEHDYDSCSFQKYSEFPSSTHSSFWYAENIETVNHCKDYGDSLILPLPSTSVTAISSSPKAESSDICINKRNLERCPLPINTFIVADTLCSLQRSPASSSISSLISRASSPTSSYIPSPSTSPAPLPQDSFACEKECSEVAECNGPDFAIENSPEKHHVSDQVQSSEMLTVVLEYSTPEKIANTRSADRRIFEDTAVFSDSESLIVATKAAAGSPEILLSVMSEPESESSNALGVSEDLLGCVESIEGSSFNLKSDASWADEVDNAKFEPMYPPVTVVKPALENKPVPLLNMSQHKQWKPHTFHYCCQLRGEEFTPESWDEYNWASCWTRSRFRPQDSDSSRKSTRFAVDNIDFMRCKGVRPGVRFSYEPLEKALARFNPSRVDCFNPRLDGTAQLTAICYGIVDFETVEQASVAFAFLQGRRMGMDEAHWRLAFLDPEDETCGGRRFVDKPVARSQRKRIVAGTGERRRPGTDIRALVSATQAMNNGGRRAMRL